MIEINLFFLPKKIEFSYELRLVILYVPLVKPYMDPQSIETTPATEEMKTMLPDPEAFRKGCESWLR